MRVREIKIVAPEELACQLTQTIAAQVFAVCALNDKRPIDAGIRKMSVHVEPNELISSLSALDLLIDRLTQQDSRTKHQLSKRTIINLQQLNVLVHTIHEYTAVDIHEDAWTGSNGNEEDNDD